MKVINTCSKLIRLDIHNLHVTNNIPLACDYIVFSTHYINYYNEGHVICAC